MALSESWQPVQLLHCLLVHTGALTLCVEMLVAATGMPLSAATGGRCGDSGVEGQQRLCVKPHRVATLSLGYVSDSSNHKLIEKCYEMLTKKAE